MVEPNNGTTIISVHHLKKPNARLECRMIRGPGQSNRYDAHWCVIHEEKIAFIEAIDALVLLMQSE